MTLTFMILISAVVLLTVSAISLCLLLKPRLSPQYKIIQISKTTTISIGSGRRTNGFKHALLKRRSTFLTGGGVETIKCYQRPTSSRWFRCNNHIAIPISLSNRLNGELRRLEQWK